MKKIAVLVSLLTLSALSSEAPVAIPYGFYVGVHGGLSQTNIRHSIQNDKAPSNPMAMEKKAPIGKSAHNWGALGGYNVQLGNNYVAGWELFVQNEATKVDPLRDRPTATTTAVHTIGNTTLQRRFMYGGMGRLGVMVTPTVMGYVGLGLENSLWEATFTPDPTVLNRCGAPTHHQVNKKHLSLRMAAGVDFFKTDIMFLRLQYHYVMGPKIVLNYDCSLINPRSSFYGSNLIQIMKTSQHVVAVGIGRRF
jgi:opacity protein-like surface antigen